MAGRGRDERAMLRGAQAGSAGDFEALFRRHWPGAYRAAYLVVHDHQAAEDITQEAFIAAVRSLERFDRRRPFAPWLHRIVVNRAIDWARTRNARRELLGEPPDIIVSRDPAPEVSALQGDTTSLARSVSALLPEQRAVVVLRYLLGYTPGEIAELLELPRGTVNSRLRRGLDHLAEQLPAEEEASA